jgi:hypothetical protein
VSTIITAPEAIEPSNSLTAPTVGASEDTWGAILNEQTFVTLLAYILWLQARSTAWGGITGTLSDQTDLQTALDGKATSAQGALADTSVQPGDPLTDLGSGVATSGHVPKADGTGGIAWAAESGGGGGGGDIALADGLVVVKHGANASVARPAAGSVYWQGSVAPSNRALGDWWLDTPAYD